MTEKSIYLSSWALTEPDDIFYFYQPTWLNAWEAHMYERGLYGTRANGWGLKRFGVENDIYAPERIRNPQYMPYLEAMEQVTDSALQQMPTKERMKLMKSRTAFIYADSWGESGSFEKISSALHIATIDTLPKNLLKKFSITEPTCKIRGEKQAFVQALRMAQDYLAWDVFDNVVICAAYRAIPVLVFSEEDVGKPPKRLFPRRADEVNLSVERVGCFILSQRESAIRLQCGEYHSGTSPQHATDIDVMAFSERQQMPSRPAAGVIDLVAHYGESGCLTPALSMDYLTRHIQPGGKMRTVIADKQFGYHYFDLEYLEG
ncbi:ATP-binding protein [Escherichia coli]|nr:ATP-binding protein [Escherichia coli]EIV8344954.1 ATP-binding protein [Escherichia coli]EKS5494193.1 ATP-binding protein [Escherichia coli]